MALEDDIKQDKGFKSERHKALVNILYTEGWLRNRMNEILKPYKLTGQQYNVLRILRGSSPEPLSTSCIRERMLDKMSDASRIVDRLNKKGLLERNTCSSDKRLVDVHITDAGLRLLAEIDGPINEMTNLFGTVTEEEAAMLNGILDRLRA